MFQCKASENESTRRRVASGIMPRKVGAFAASAIAQITTPSTAIIARRFVARSIINSLVSQVIAAQA